MFLKYLANADSEAPNKPYVSASSEGGIYAKCTSKEILGELGKTQVYKMSEKGEELLCSFDWFPSGGIYLIDNFNNGGNFYSIVRIGPWPAGNNPDNQLSIAFYNDCKEIKRYSTADIV